MLSKRGQVTEQFNWMFAIIAGGIILLFFIFVLGQVRATADAKLAATVLNNFDAILTGSSVTPNALSIIDSTKLLVFDVSCEDDGLSELTLDGSSSRIDLSQKLLYSPGLSTGKRLYVYAHPIERPFDLGNALLMTGDNTLFLVYDPSDKEGLNKLYEQLPTNLSSDKVSLFTRDVEVYDRIIILSDVAAPGLSKSYDDVMGEDVLIKKDAMWIDLDFVGDEARQATVYTKSYKDKTFEYGGETMLPSTDFAMILGFSQDLSFYECNFNKINRKLKVVSKIYLERVNFLIDEVASTNCQMKYIQAKDKLTQMTESRTGFMDEDVVEGLAEINHGLLLGSCPLIY